MTKLYAALLCGLMLLGSPCFGAEKTEPPLSLAEIRVHRFQHMHFSGTEDLYLYAPDQEVKFVEHGYCGANERDTEFNGHYYLVLTRDNKIVSQVEVGNMMFVDEEPWNGFDFLRFGQPGDPNPKTVYVRILQYEACRLGGGGRSYVFAVEQGQIHPVSFVNLDGSRSDSAVEIHEGKDGSISSTEWQEPLGNGLIEHDYRRSGDPMNYDFYEVETVTRPDSTPPR